MAVFCNPTRMLSGFTTLLWLEGLFLLTPCSLFCISNPEELHITFTAKFYGKEFVREHVLIFPVNFVSDIHLG